MPRFSASAMNSSRSQRVVIEALSMTLIPTPLPSSVTRMWSWLPGMSTARVVSSAMPTCGSTLNALVSAPRRPTSSWVVKTAWTSNAGSWRRFSACTATQQPALSSSALPVTTLPRSWNSCRSVTMSPTRTLALTSSAPRPRSTKKSESCGTFERSSCVLMWMGLPDGFITPTSSSPDSEACTVTWRAKRLRGSKPPSCCRRRKPLSSMNFTRKPISSMWAASIARGAPSSLARFTACRLPIASVSSSSTTPFSSASMISRTRSSRPGTPAASESLFRSSMRGSLLQEPVRDGGGQVARALLLHGVPAAGQQDELGAGRLRGQPLGLLHRHHAVLGSGDDQQGHGDAAEAPLEARRRLGLGEPPQRDVPALDGERLEEGVDALLRHARGVVPAGAEAAQAGVGGALAQQHGSPALELGRAHHQPREERAALHDVGRGPDGDHAGHQVGPFESDVQRHAGAVTVAHEHGTVEAERRDRARHQGRLRLGGVGVKGQVGVVGLRPLGEPEARQVERHDVAELGEQRRQVVERARAVGEAVE